MMRILLLGLTLVFWTSAAVAQSTATLLGSVLSDPTERPIANAVVSIPALNLTTRSDSLGGFTLGRITAGRHVVNARAVGFVEITTSMVFGAGQRVEADLLLSPTSQELAKVEVVAKSASGDSPRIAEFDARKKLGQGRFITQDVFEKANGRKMADVLIGRIPGIRTLERRGTRVLVSSRGVSSLNNQVCYVRVFVDGVLASEAMGDVGFPIDRLEPLQIAAAEFYTPATLPAELNFGGLSPCGSLFLWTRYSTP